MSISKSQGSLLIILFLGLILRFYNNLNISLWHDEAFSALMIRYPWGEMFYRLGLDVHPPAYYVFLRIWHYIFGESLLSLRGMSIFFGVGTIWAAYLFTKEAFKNEKAALWAAFFIAVNPFQLKYVTEARMYTMGAFFTLLSGYLLLKALTSQKTLFVLTGQNMPNHPDLIKQKRITWAYFIGFTLSMVVIIYTHYYLFFTASALGLFGLLYVYFHHEGNWKKFIPLLASFIVIIASFLPWLKVFLFQYKQVQAGYWIQKMTVWSIPSTFWDMLLGFSRDASKSTTQLLLIVVSLFSLFLFYRFLRKTQGFAKWLVLFAVLAPFGGALLFALMAKLKGSNSSVYLDRYFLFASVYYSVALAVWMKEIKIKWLSVLLFVIYCGLNLIAFANYWQKLDVDSRKGMSGAADYLKQNVESQHHVFLGTSYEFFNYKYYATAVDIIPTRPLLFTGGRPYSSQLSHVEGVALLEDADLVPDFATAVNSQDTVWLVWTYAFGSNKPQVPLNWKQIGEEKEYPDVRPYLGTTIYITKYLVN